MARNRSPIITVVSPPSIRIVEFEPTLDLNQISRKLSEATQDYADLVIRPCADRSHARSPRGARNRNGRYLLGARRNGRASGASICAVAQAPRSRCDSFRVGRLDYSSVASPAGRTPAIFFAAHSRRVRGRPAIRGRSYTSYGRILFKASSITLFGRIHVDKQNSFISEKCDFAGLWELARASYR